MRFSWPNITVTRGGIAAVALVLVIVLGLFSVQLLFVYHNLHLPGMGPDPGLSPEWNCNWPGKGDSVCIKLLKKPDNPP
jgi:hypothetical protein